MNIGIETVKSIFRFSLKIYNGEVELLWMIENEKHRWLWLCYSNAKHDKRVFKRTKGKYHFCLQIPKIITIDTAHIGKKIFGRLNLTRLLKKDYHVYSTGDYVCQSG